MILLRQALRSIWRGRRSYLACIVLMSVGIACYVSFHLLFLNLTASMEGLYDSQRFGDGFAKVGAIPLSAVDRLRDTPGIDRLDASVTADLRVDDPDSNRVVTLRVSSWEEERQEPLNAPLLVEGSFPAQGEILLGEAFANAGGYRPGDTVTLLYKGQEESLTVSGLAQSPEYVYAIPDTGQLMPDNESFGFGYMALEQLSSLTGLAGSANSLSFTLAEGFSYSTAETALKESLAPYGLISLFPRNDQPSHGMLKQEIDSIGAMSDSLPMAFILLSAIILYIMMRRIIEQERTQIGTMKAFGLTDRRVLLHYLTYGGITGLLGGLLGVGMGVLMTGGITEMYLEFFSLPSLRVPPDPALLLQGAAIALGTGVFGALMGARSILKLGPSEAMRPASPPAVKGDLVGKIPFLRRLLSSLGFMAVRNIARNKFRSGFVVLGVAFAFAITALMSSMGDMFDIMLLDQFTKVELYNLKITMSQPSSYTPALESVYSLESVRRAEGLLELPVELHSGHLKKSVVLVSMKSDSSLYKIYDGDSGGTYPPPQGGVILSTGLADDLHAARGDVLLLKTPYTGNETFRVPVLGTVQTSLGAVAYMELDSLWGLLDIPPTLSSVMVDTDSPDVLRASLIEAVNVSSIGDREQTKRSYLDLLDSYMWMINLLQVAGAIIAFAIITNTASISLSERKREYATMRVMGMLPGEIGKVVGFEYWTLSLLSLPFGILFTGWLKRGVAAMVDNDIFTIPLHTEPSSYVAAALFCAAAVLLSNLAARRKIARFDMVEVLKERE
ncbi:MAG: ABC transporter permease [Oscillospiraceae bacterium]